MHTSDLEHVVVPSRAGDVDVLVHRRGETGAGAGSRWIWLLHGRGARAGDLRGVVRRLVEAMDDGTLPSASLAAPDGPWSQRSHWWVDSRFDGDGAGASAAAARAGHPAADAAELSVPGTAVESALLRDVLPTVEAGSPVTGRGVVGISMGGAAACRWALAAHGQPAPGQVAPGQAAPGPGGPGLVEWAALLSPAAYDVPPPSSSARTGGAFGLGASRHDEATYRRLMAPAALLDARPVLDHRPPGTDVRISITVGDAEPAQDLSDGEPADLTFAAARLHALLKRRADVRSDLRVVAGGHGWPMWEREVVDAVRRAQAL